MPNSELCRCVHDPHAGSACPVRFDRSICRIAHYGADSVEFRLKTCRESPRPRCRPLREATRNKPVRFPSDQPCQDRSPFAWTNTLPSVRHLIRMSESGRNSAFLLDLQRLVGRLHGWVSRLHTQNLRIEQIRSGTYYSERHELSKNKSKNEHMLEFLSGCDASHFEAMICGGSPGVSDSFMDAKKHGRTLGNGRIGQDGATGSKAPWHSGSKRSQIPDQLIPLRDAQSSELAG